MKKMFEELKQEILKCKLCEEKFGFEPHPILMGNVNSKIMQIEFSVSQSKTEGSYYFTYSCNGFILKFSSPICSVGT